ncbi:MAG: ABC transporter permease [Melioribacteraceae bacterium]|nr:ABC transporter permease [Melioribacteraceae bacterium]
MIKNYIIVTLRNIFNNKIYSFINLLGLSVGIACTILIIVWVRYELGYDNFHTKLNQIYRVVTEYDGFRTPTTPGPMAAYLKSEIPEIVEATRFKGDNIILQYRDKSCKINGINAEPMFLDLFTFPSVKGNPALALDDASSIVLTQSGAEKLFGDEDPIGKVVKVSNKWTATVKSVVEDVPKNSSPPLNFEYLYPFKVYYYWRDPDNWTNNSDYNTWVLLDEKADFTEVNRKIDELIKRHNPDPKLKFFVQPLSEIHLNANTHRWDGPHGDINTVLIFSFLAMIILAIACINFTNLATAKSSLRSKEIGIRKVIGATRLQIIKQHLGESFIFTSLSVPISLIMIELFLPSFNEIAGNIYSINYLESWFIISLISILIITAFFSGLYPSIMLSSLGITKILQENESFSNDRKNWSQISFRKVLVIFQFSISIIVIISTLLIFNQLQYIFEKDLGYDAENLLYITTGRNYSPEVYERFNHEILELSSVVSTGSSDQIPTDTDFVLGVNYFHNDQKISASSPAFMIDENFLANYKIELIAGENFKPENKTSLKESFIINETAVREFGLKNPIGSYFEAYNRKGKVIGVVKDFHFENLKEKIEPLVFMYFDECYFLNIRIKSNNTAESINSIKALVEKHFPGHPFIYSFVDDKIEALYKKEVRMGELFKYFSFLAIFISILGLYGLVAFIVDQKTKEISIRKVLGSSVSSVVRNLISSFIIWIVIANIIAWPITYWAITKWLQNFEYKTEIDLGVFVIVGVIILLLSLFTVSLHAVKAALINPVKNLRNE